MDASLGEILALLMFLATIFVVLIGYPIAFSLAGTALIFAGIGHLLGVFDDSTLLALPARYMGTMENEVLVAVPLFVFMGVMLERSKIAEELLTTMGQLFGRLRGGLGLSVILVGALLAASTGIVGATVVTMGLLSLPAMMRAGYDKTLASGVICASGTLGQIIPPSTVLIFVADMLQSANQAVQLERGALSPDTVSVGDLFVGAVIPGLVLVGLYVAYVLAMAVLRPASCPALVVTPAERAGLPRRIVFALLPALLLILAVLGSIIAGVATATESASFGAVGALLLAAANRQLSFATLQSVMRSTLKISSMVFVILLGASVFSLVFRGLGGEAIVTDAIGYLPEENRAFYAMLFTMALLFVLGFFLDTFEILFITLPICAPILLRLGVDPIWLGVMIGINMQTSFLTPPFGFSLFYLRGVAGRLLTTADIYRGAMPFVILQLIGLALVWGWPSLATWLPEKVFAAPPASSVPAGGDLQQMLQDQDGGGGEIELDFGK